MKSSASTKTQLQPIQTLPTVEAVVVEEEREEEEEVRVIGANHKKATTLRRIHILPPSCGHHPLPPKSPSSPPSPPPRHPHPSTFLEEQILIWRPYSIREKPNTCKRRHKKKKAKKATTNVAYRRGCSGYWCRRRRSVSPARLSAFKKLIPWAVEGKVKESLAVVKRSDDPYEDFKRSTMDMICEK